MNPKLFHWKLIGGSRIDLEHRTGEQMSSPGPGLLSGGNWQDLLRQVRELPGVPEARLENFRRSDSKSRAYIIGALLAFRDTFSRISSASPHPDPGTAAPAAEKKKKMGMESRPFQKTPSKSESAADKTETAAPGQRRQTATYSRSSLSRTAVLDCGREGCHQENLLYYRDYLENGRHLGRGHLFVGTLPSTPLCEAAISLGLNGPAYYMDPLDRNELLWDEIEFLLEEDENERVLLFHFIGGILYAFCFTKGSTLLEDPELPPSRLFIKQQE